MPADTVNQKADAPRRIDAAAIEVKQAELAAIDQEFESIRELKAKLDDREASLNVRAEKLHREINACVWAGSPTSYRGWAFR